ncbi:MAG: ABC transporter ATP-binding protein, partial [Pseudomonadota bacterium]
GKTSLMMLIGGLVRATDGHIYLDEHDIRHWSEDQLAQLRADKIAIVFQGFHLLPNLTAFENVSLALELKSDPQNKQTIHQETNDILEKVGLSHRLNHYPAQLSGGEQQRVALARAFVRKPRLLLADEPTGNLDSETGKKIMDIMFSLSERFGSSLVLITHDEALAKRCSQQYVMRDGQLFAK